MRRVLVVVAILLFAMSCGDDDGPSPDGGPSLIGAWTGIETGGGAEAWTFTFGAADGSAMSDGTETYAFTYIDRPDEDPNQIDITFTESMYPPYVGETAQLIYRLGTDTLTLASSEPGTTDRPTDFIAGGATRVWELTRQ